MRCDSAFSFLKAVQAAGFGGSTAAAAVGELERRVKTGTGRRPRASDPLRRVSARRDSFDCCVVVCQLCEVSLQTQSSQTAKYVRICFTMCEKYSEKSTENPKVLLFENPVQRLRERHPPDLLRRVSVRRASFDCCVASVCQLCEVYIHRAAKPQSM